MLVNNVIMNFHKFGILPHKMPNAIGMWPNEMECLLWALEDEYVRDGEWLEIGSFCGGSAVLMALMRKELKKNFMIHCVDKQFSLMFDYNIKRGGFKNIITHQIPSNDFKWEENKISFALIDGFHSFKQVIQDFEKIFSDIWIKEGGIIAFHDVSPKIFNKEYRCSNIITDDMAGELLENTDEDFYIDEAILYILRRYQGYVSFLDCPLRRDVDHSKETGLTEWVRGKTSPTNSIAFLRVDK